LWTGIIDTDKAALVAKHLLSDACFSGWGVRTLAETMAGYNPISYHNGSVWPHDNAICAAGLMRYGFIEESHRVIEGQVAAGAYFGNRMPELFSGLARQPVPFPVSYPTSCAPQAWAAASPLLFLRTMLRFEPDIRNEELHLAPAVPDWIGSLRLEQIPLMGGQLSIEVQRDRLRTLTVPRGLTIVQTPRRPTT
jgi:glycogen debranching enzyme